MNIVDKIIELKKKRNAVILVHNYQIPEIQGIADFLGDSLELSIKASKTKAEVIVFCGVQFMAETAAILCPQKTVLLPDLEAGCPMANMITPEALIEMQRKHPRAQTVCYVNSSAAVKAESDICCTSSNAVDIVKSLGEGTEVIFVPDKYLAAYVAKKLNRKIIAWEGYCPSHIKILRNDIERQKKLHPDALVLVHPECTPDVIDLADAALSTSGMCRYVQDSDRKEFIIGTEVGMVYRLEKEHPEKEFYPATDLSVCPNMKKITLEKVLGALEEMQYVVTVPDEIRVRARTAVDRMIALAR